MQYISVFLDLATFTHFRYKNADLSRTQGLCYMVNEKNPFRYIPKSSSSKIFLESLNFFWEHLFIRTSSSKCLLLKSKKQLVDIVTCSSMLVIG